MNPLERLYTAKAEIYEVADQVADGVAGQQTDARSRNAHTGKWRMIDPKHAERENILTMTSTTAIQTSAGSMSKHATTAVCQDTSRLTASTSNVSRINGTTSMKGQHPHHLLQEEIVT